MIQSSKYISGHICLKLNNKTFHSINSCLLKKFPQMCKVKFDSKLNALIDLLAIYLLVLNYLILNMGT